MSDGLKSSTFVVPDKIKAAADQPGADSLARMLEHRSQRRYTAQAVDPALLKLLFACALSAPSKSDLQQADIVHVSAADKRKAIADLIPDNPWVRTAPVFLIFCGNNRRTRQVADLRGKPFANDHLDAFMNSAVDAGMQRKPSGWAAVRSVRCAITRKR